jgi:hypothetical protein
MALYQARGTEPAQSKRIDGQVWSAVGPGSTLRGWTYPTMHESSQFARFNALVRSLDSVWDGLSGSQQDGWNAVPCPWPLPAWWLWCNVGTIYPYSAWDGREAFRVVQCIQAFCGWPPALDAPVSSSPDHGDTLTWGQNWDPPAPSPPMQTHVTARWDRAVGLPPPEVGLLVRAAAAGAGTGETWSSRKPKGMG